MRTANQVATLIKKYIEGTISSEETIELMAWVNENPAHKAFLHTLSTTDNVWEDALAYVEFMDQQEDDWLAKFTLKTQEKIAAKEKRRLFHKRTIWLVAAAILLMGTFSGYIYMFGLKPNDPSIEMDMAQIAPAGNKAELILSNGKKIDLRSDKDGINNNNTLSYSDGTPILSEDVEYMENISASIVVPAGGKYQVTLPDGTDVWLNAQSKLSYPLVFSTKSREVHLEGEAYFAVKTTHKNGKKVPFVVNCNNQQVEVTGTEFNISAYEGDSETLTTLVEGSVNILADKHKISLKPNQQAIPNASGIHKQQVNVEHFIAWKKNKFLFYETELQQVMKDISRWYNIEVDFKAQTTPTYLYGEIGRDKNLAEVLQLLQKSGIRFKMTKIGSTQRLTVLP